MILKKSSRFSSVVVFSVHLHEGADIFNRHASSFETVDHFQRTEIVVRQTANPAGSFLSIRE